MAGEPLKGRRYVEVHETKTKKDWALFVEQIVAHYPKASKIRLVLDNLRTHSQPHCMRPFHPKKQRRYGTGWSLSIPLCMAPG